MTNRYSLVLLAVVLLFAVAPARAADGWKVGAAAVRITPDKPIWLTGFAARTTPSRGKLHELYAKALALEDGDGRLAVLVTSDLLGFPSQVADRIAGEVQRRHSLPRDRLVLNASHTHGASALASPTEFIYGPRVTPEQRKDVEDYTRRLEAAVIDVISQAIEKRRPARLHYGQGEAAFGVNRRKPTDKGIAGFTPNPEGPVDRAVPVLRVDSDAGELIAVVFGYAAHPTTITTGPEYYHFSGDYPAVAQQAIEAEHPGTVALFVEGCAGDVMVFPRGSAALANKYGADLGRVVEQTLALPTLKPIRGPIRSAYETVAIEFATPPTREALLDQLKSEDVYYQAHARAMLGKLDRDKALPASYPYSIQAWQFGDDLTFVAMAGEVVSDYSLRFKREFGGGDNGPAVWVAGYSNDLCSYIPTRQVLLDGGYEADRSMIYYMHPGPYAPSVEEAIVGKTRVLVGRVRGK